MPKHKVGDLVFAGSLGIITKINKESDFIGEWYYVEWCSEGNEIFRGTFQDNEVSYFKEVLDREYKSQGW